MTEIQLSSFNRRVVELYQSIDNLLVIYFDAPSDEPGKRGKRYTFVFENLEDVEVTRLDACAAELRAEEPEFAWNYLDDLNFMHDPSIRTCIWERKLPTVPELSNAPLDNIRLLRDLNAPHINVRRFLWDAVKDIDRVVAVTCSPADVVPRGGAVNASIVVRMDMHAPDVEALREIDRRVTALRKTLPELVEAQAAPELNFPPTGAGETDQGFAWLDHIGEIMRVVEPFKMVVAVWFREPLAPRTPPQAFIYGEDAPALRRVLKETLDTDPIFVTDPFTVPKEAKCIFNPVTRLIKAQAEGDAEEVERQKKVIMGGRDPNAGPRPIPRAGAEGHFVPCRWCGFSIPASTNPAYQERCPNCSAIQSATTLPTKSVEAPLLSIFINPDNTAYFEFVYAPPIAGRWDLSKVTRCTVPGEFFEQHPMGRSPAELTRRAKETKKS